MAEQIVKRKDNFSTRALECIQIEGNTQRCKIDPMSGCVYSQDRLDIGNFLRHFRMKHPEASIRLQLVGKSEVPPKKNRTVAKVLVAMDRTILLQGCIKLVTKHHLPLYCFEWEGFRLILDPISEALKFGINRHNIKDHLSAAALKIKEAITAEMRGKMVSVMIDSATKHNRHIICLQAQYESAGEIVIRTLAVLEVREGQTAKFLKDKMLEVFKAYELDIQQIFSATSDNGANMVAAIKQLQALSEIEDDPEDFEDNQDDPDNDSFLEAVQHEFASHLNLVRCAAHTVQLAVGDVVKKNDRNVKLITEFVKESRKVKYSLFFDHKNASRAPLWGITRWNGKYEMFQAILKQEDFYCTLGQQFKDLELSDSDWLFLKNFVNAFEPVYRLTKTLQKKHVSLNEFYLQWLRTTYEVEKVDSPFSKPLSQALKERLKKLTESFGFKAALFLDPRVNFPGSTIFTTGDEKEAVQSYLKSLWIRLKSIKEAAPSTLNAGSASSQACPAILDKSGSQDDMDSFISEMFGGSPSFTSEVSSFHKQLRQLETEPRQPFNYDPWNHWKARKSTHPELYELAMVVLAAPSTQVPVERAFSALGLVFSDLRTGLSDDVLQNILLIKLNGDIFDKVLPHLYDWKTMSMDS